MAKQFLVFTWVGGGINMQSLDQIRKIYLKIFGNSCGIAQITNLAESRMAFRLLDRFGSQRFMSGCPKHIFKNICKPKSLQVL